MMPSARDWILVLYGRFIRNAEQPASLLRPGWVASAHLVALGEALGCDSASIRTAIHRMKRAGFVETERRGGTAGYRLTQLGEQFFADGDHRVMDRDAGADTDDRWVLASFSVPETRRRIRYRIRSGLLELGFGQLTSGLLIAPQWLHAEATRFVDREGVGSWMSLWVGDYAGPGDIREVVEEAWDLDALRGRYVDYLAETRAVLDREPADDREAFVAFAANVNAWRELRYADPVLPASALPRDWPADRAHEVFDELDRRLSPAAIQYVRACAPDGGEAAA